MIFIYLLLGLIVAMLIAAYFMSPRFNIEKSAIIKRPVQAVMASVGDLNQYSEWNPWQQADKSAKRTITGTPMVPGHRYEWSGKKVGVGSLTLRNVDAKHLNFDLEFVKPWKSSAKDNWLFEPWGDDETKVTWQNSGELPWPIARLMGPMISKGLATQFDKGLANLKIMVEA